MLPVRTEYTHEVVAFLRPVYGLKGAVKTSVNGASCIRSYGQQATWLSLFALGELIIKIIISKHQL